MNMNMVLFSIVSDFSKFPERVSYLKLILQKNYFPTNLMS